MRRRIQEKKTSNWQKIKTHLGHATWSGTMMLAGIGVIHLGQLLHVWNVTIDSWEVQPWQAKAVQNQLEYAVDDGIIYPPKKKK